MTKKARLDKPTHLASKHKNRAVAKRGKLDNVKKENVKNNRRNYAIEQNKQLQRAGFSGFVVKNQSKNVKDRQQPKSAAVSNIDIHLAAKISFELRLDLAKFKCRMSTVDFFGKSLGRIFELVPPPFLQQHLPENVKIFSSYLSKFLRGAPNIVHAFILWYEWASYELNKGRGRKHAPAKRPERGAEGEQTAAAEAEGEDEREGGEDPHGADGVKSDTHKVSKARLTLSKTVKEREHIRALLQMSLRHNSARRKEGQRAFVNHLNFRLSEGVDCSSLEAFCASAHNVVVYALTRLLLGMVTEDMAMITMHAHTLFLALRDTAITPSIVLSLIGDELALEARLKVARTRLITRAASTRTKKENNENQEEDGDWDDIDPDKINDPTKGERNQRMIAAVFAMGVVAANMDKLRIGTAKCLARYLCFAYIEQKALRVMTANILFSVLERFTDLWEDETVVEWLLYSFFLYPKLEYYRPEGVQLLLRLMMMEAKPKAVQKIFFHALLEYIYLDPLDPKTVEQLANALFRKEQVTATHPMVHPVWTDWFDILAQRCTAGESMKEHLTTIMHNAIVPYRRGSADAPRRALFQQLVYRLGQLVVQNDNADQRAEMLNIASKTVGYGRRTIAKATDISEICRMPQEVLDAKVRDLLLQLRNTRDSDPSAIVNRAWVLRELRSCLYVPLREGVTCTYINDAAKALLQFGFYPSPPSRDWRSMNRAIFLFADVFSFTYTAALSRPKCTLDPLYIIQSYLEAEQKGLTRYTTGPTHSSFCKARNCIVETLENSEKRSVLFYIERDMHVLLVLLFLLLSTDDYTNDEAKELAVSTVPDLCHFFLTGTLETLDLFYDVLMTLVMRSTAPIHVLPLVTCIRRIATGYLLKFARYIRERMTLDLLLAPLREAFHTDDREKARQIKASGILKNNDGNDKESEDDDNNATEDDSSDGGSCNYKHAQANDKKLGCEREFDATGSADEESADDGSSTASTASGESADEGNDTETETEATEKESMADETDDEVGEEMEHVDISDDSDKDDEEEEEAPTQQYLDALKGMIGNADLQFVYPTDTTNKEKSNVLRAIKITARVGMFMRSPLILDIFQVLLSVCRENVKSPDDIIFNSAISSIQMLMITKNRYFGRFLQAEDMFQLLSDIQSFCRKLDHLLVRKESQSAKHAVVIRRRMALFKDVALRVFHFVAFLAYKNHAGEDVRVTLMEFYKSIFCDRGWDEKKRVPGLKRDMHHYRHGFAWALLPAALEKFRDVEGIDGPQRVRVFKSCCQLIEAILPRLSGVGVSLRTVAGVSISSFLQSLTLRCVYDMKYTLLYDYFHCLKMVLKYNSRVGLDSKWLASLVDGAISDDSLQLSAASIRLLAAIERLLGLTPRAKETKVPVPVSMLYQQFEKHGRKEKAIFYRRAKRVRTKVMRALVAYRNGDLTDAERAHKRRRREAIKIDDRIKRQLLRAEKSRHLTKEEKEEKRRRIVMAKQQRIAKNRERKRLLHEHREKAFQRWREQKLAAAAAQE